MRPRGVGGAGVFADQRVVAELGRDPRGAVHAHVGADADDHHVAHVHVAQRMIEDRSVERSRGQLVDHQLVFPGGDRRHHVIRSRAPVSRDPGAPDCSSEPCGQLVSVGGDASVARIHDASAVLAERVQQPADVGHDQIGHSVVPVRRDLRVPDAQPAFCIDRPVASLHVDHQQRGRGRVEAEVGGEQLERPLGVVLLGKPAHGAALSGGTSIQYRYACDRHGSSGRKAPSRVM